MIDLSSTSGLPITWDEVRHELSYQSDVAPHKTSVRTREEMKSYLPEGATAPDEIIYWMYRAVARAKDRPLFQTTGTRYDLTVIAPGTFQIGQEREFYRTAGHYHPSKPGTSVSYPEIFQVIAGQGHWLLQKSAPEDYGVVEENYLVEAGPGEYAIVPPGYGHISLNTGSEPLIIANILTDQFESNYIPYQTYRGGSYRILEGGASPAIEYKKNTRYPRTPKLKKIKSRGVIPELGITAGQPLYQLIDQPDKIRAMTSPEEFAAALTIEHCYLILAL